DRRVLWQLAIQPIRRIHLRQVCWGAPLRRGQEADRTRRAVAELNPEVTQGYSSRIVLRSRGQDVADERRQQNQNLFERRVVGHPYLAERGEVRQEYRQRRLHLIKQPRHLVRSGRSLLQQ